MRVMENKKIIIDYSRFKNYITYLQNYGMCFNFNKEVWSDFVNKSISYSD